MKKKTTIFLLFAATAILFGWLVLGSQERAGYDASLLDPSYENPGNCEQIFLTAEDNGYSYKSKYIDIQLTNDTDEIVVYGRRYQLETLIDGEWYKVPAFENSMFTLEAINAFPHTSSEEKIWLGAYQCRPGKHRIIKEVSVEEYKEPRSLDELESQLKEDRMKRSEKGQKEKVQIAIEFDLI